jgi:hypothetical protein
MGREFHTDVPIFVNTSRAEVLYDSNCESVANLMKKGCMFGLLEINHATHVTFETEDLIGWEAEQWAAMDLAVESVKRARTPISPE